MQPHIPRDNQPDYLHLNDAGLKLLSASIKNAIFVSKRQRQDGSTRHSSSGGLGQGSGSGPRQHTGETYAGVVDRPPHRGRRGGRSSRGRGRGRPP